MYKPFDPASRPWDLHHRFPFPSLEKLKQQNVQCGKKALGTLRCPLGED